MRPLLVSWAIVLVSVCSYKRDAMTSKMSNGGATDVYLSNSRCVRDNHTSVDNNVFTGRLPVSTGPQHHQWPQQQHQLLMQADDNTQLFADNGHCAWVKLILVRILSLQFISWLKGINHMSTWLLFVLIVVYNASVTCAYKNIRTKIDLLVMAEYIFQIVNNIPLHYPYKLHGSSMDW